jgi:hypothetical protein
MASFHAKHPSFSSGATFNDISGSEILAVSTTSQATAAQSQQTHYGAKAQFAVSS